MACVCVTHGMCVCVLLTACMRVCVCARVYYSQCVCVRGQQAVVSSQRKTTTLHTNSVLTLLLPRQPVNHKEAEHIHTRGGVKSEDDIRCSDWSEGQRKEDYQEQLVRIN